MADTGGAPEEPTDSIDTVPDEVVPEGADVVTVSELSQAVENLVDTSAGLQHDYVLGDVANPSTSASGHLYFTLEGEESELQCVAFGFRRSALATEPADGMRVLVEGDLQYYAPRSQLSVQVTDCHDLGEGSYSQVYEQTRARLDEDGLLADDHKQPLPGLPERIGLVTSRHGDAVDDAVQSIHARHPGVDVRVAHTSVQGEAAVENIVTSVGRLDEAPDVDLIVVTRGGGADSTLRTFDELAVCRTIARTDTPIAVGIGHETDETLAGQVADERIITPTDAGRLVPDQEALDDRLAVLDDRLAGTYRSQVRSQFDTFRSRHERAYRSAVTGELQSLHRALETAATGRLQTRVEALATEVEAAYTTYEQTVSHAQEVAAVRRRYRLAIAGLVVLLALVVVATFVP